MISDNQVLKFSKIYQETGDLTMSSLKSGMSYNSGAKYLKVGKLPSELKDKLKGRPRENPFVPINDELIKWIKENSKIQATSLLPHLQEKYPGKYPDNMLRSLQRQMKAIRLELHNDREVFFDQEHKPGKKMQLDWTWCNELKITIQRNEFNHKLCHCVLTYSGWEWATICISESYMSLAHGFQETVFKLGKVPEVLQTDNSSAATHRIKKDKVMREFNQKYIDFTDHHGVIPKTSNIGCPNENGCVESLNGHLKNRLEQALILRGSREFDSQEAYQLFLEDVLNKANKPREDKLQDELFFMKDVAPIRLPEYREEFSKVNKGSLVRLHKTTYSVPSKHIGSDLRFRSHEQFIDVYQKQKFLFSMPRETNRKASINYRHVISSLRQKPGAFDSYKYREHMFPSFVFRKTYDHLTHLYHNRLADREYLEILFLAANEGESRISRSLQDMLSDTEVKLSLFELKTQLGLNCNVNETILVASLVSYDSLVTGENDVQ